MRGLHIKVSGLVQGVGYRYYCRSAAEGLGITGYVMNLDSGDVEIRAFGPAQGLNEFVSEITRSDKSFSVVDMSVDDIEYDGSYSGFKIKFY